MRFLRFYCGDRRLEEIEGDLFELYNDFVEEKGPRFATFFYWWLVIRNIRSYAFKKSKMKNKGATAFIMFFGHNLKVSWRDLLKNRTTSLINVLGLSIGLASFILIYRIITFELSFNTHLPDSDRVARIYTDFEGVNGGQFTNMGVAVPVAGYVRDNLKGLEVLSHFHTFSSEVKISNARGSFEEHQNNNRILLADSSYFQIVDQYVWLSGSRDESLNKPFQVVLTEAQARLYFDDLELDEMIGKTIIYQDSLKTIVSGIVRQEAVTTDFDFTEMISYSTIRASWLEDNYDPTAWGNTNSNSQLFVKSTSLAARQAMEQQMVIITDSILRKNEDNAWRRSFFLQPLDDLHYNAGVGIFDSSPAPIYPSTLKTLGAVALLLLLIAIFNFINLETAQASTKLKEVGIRKVIGSTRRLLLGRFIFNALIITFASIAVAVPLTSYSISIFSEFVPAKLTLGLDQLDFWAFLIGTGLAVGLIAGLYPSILISTQSVAAALKQGLNRQGKSNKSYLRKGLIIFQFIFSQFLIMGTVVVLTQINFMLDKDLGFDQDGIVYAWIPWHTPDEKSAVLKNELSTIPEIQEISLNSGTPARRGWSTSTLTHMKDSVESQHRAHVRSGDSEYFELFGIDVLAGRMVLSREEGQEVLINETFRKELGYATNEDGIGARLGDNYIVVGVTSDFHTQSLHFDVEPTFYRYSEGENYVAMKVNLQQDLPQTIDNITAAWERVLPETELDLKFMDETVERFYSSEKKTSKLASLATGIAIFISCLGLFGLISFTTVQRTKEIGIRKVLGASVVQIGNVISKEFMVLIVLSLLFSIPLSYYYTHQWLENFSFQIDVAWWIYGLGGIVSIIVAFLSVGFKIWQASSANPVESLRYE